jgi:hypothetical protein
MRTAILTLVGFFLTIAVQAQELTAYQILEKYYQANSFDKLQKINTIIMSGIIFQSTTMPIKITKMRPDRYRLDKAVGDIPVSQACDGKEAWEIMTPWTQSEKAQPMAPGAAIDFRMRADFDGVIYHWREKGHQVELEGEEKCRDTDVYKIKLIRTDSVKEYYYIDSKDFLLRKKSRNINSRGKVILNESYFSDYKEVEGILFPFTNDNFVDGQAYSTIEFDTIELNQPVDKELFKMPK